MLSQGVSWLQQVPRSRHMGPDRVAWPCLSWARPDSSLPGLPWVYTLAPYPGQSWSPVPPCGSAGNRLPVSCPGTSWPLAWPGLASHSLIYLPGLEGDGEQETTGLEKRSPTSSFHLLSFCLFLPLLPLNFHPVLLTFLFSFIFSFSFFLLDSLDL